MLAPEKGRASTGSWGLPQDLVQKAADRLRAMAILYAVVFFLAGLFPSLLSSVDRAMLFGHVEHWLVPTVSIAVALFVAQFVSRRTFTGRRLFRH